MVQISNTRVYDLRESVMSCRNSMRTSPVDYDDDDDYEKSFRRAVMLAKSKVGSGESNFRVGIRVSFDIKYPGYLSPELQRYHFFDIVCSMSKMHRLSVFDKETCFNEYVTHQSIMQMKELSETYNNCRTYENFMRLVSNCPQGIELTMRCSTNYEQLATIYRQRRNHKLKQDWGAVCDWIETLPFADELIIS